MEEVWKDIEGYEGLYQVSNLARVRSLDRMEYGEGRGFPRLRRGRVLVNQTTTTGYYMVHLCKNNVRHMAVIHRLIAAAFIPNPENKREVNHIDGNKKNNKIENLEWCSHHENMLHAWKTGLSKVHHNKVNKKRVEITSPQGVTTNFDSISEAAKFIGAPSSNVSFACSGRIKTAKGYKCRFM